MGCTLSQQDIDRAVSFHGHMCPGLALGLRAAEWALQNMGCANDEDIVTITETDMCAVDAISLRPRDNDFFKKYIQQMDFEHLLQLDADRQDTEAKTNIIKNAALLINKVENHFTTPDEVTAFGAFLVQRCFLVTVSTPTKASAYRVFSVMNSRGKKIN